VKIFFMEMSLFYWAMNRSAKIQRLVAKKLSIIFSFVYLCDAGGTLGFYPTAALDGVC
jgi:hypothetical protein